MTESGKTSFKVQKAIEKLHSSREVAEYIGNKIKSDIRTKSGLLIPKDKSISKNVIAIVKELVSYGFRCDINYIFNKKKKFVFDIVVLPIEQKIAIDYENVYERSRFTGISINPKVWEKNREALIRGWRVLRYSNICIETKSGVSIVVNDLKKLIESNE